MEGRGGRQSLWDDPRMGQRDHWRGVRPVEVRRGGRLVAVVVGGRWKEDKKDYRLSLGQRSTLRVNLVG